MQKHFTLAMEKIEGLINLWSAPSAVSSDDSKVLLAVSGGIDSMCMAEVFLNKFGSDAFALAHCNFHLRGEESDGDEALVCNWARENGVKCHVAHFDTGSVAREQGVSIEMAARELRYGWFADLCAEYGYVAVSVAHNANDNAETLLLNLLRGTGLRGLRGMSPVSDLPVVMNGGRLFPEGRKPYLIRPLLEVTRKQIEGYALAHRVRYREDSTNALSDYKRNRIRNEVFPIFEKINPSFVRTLNREMGYFAEASDIVDNYCDAQNISSIIRNETKDLLAVSVPGLLGYSNWKYLLYYILEPYGFNSATVASIENLLESDRTLSGKRFESATHELVVERTELCIRPLISDIIDGSEDQNSESVMVVRAPGIYNFNGCRWKVEVLERTPDMPLKQPEGVLIADADKLRFPFVCRRWRQGDWLIPFGMKGKKKVSDMFADLKFTSVRKDRSVMIVDCRGQMAEQQHIAGILGVRMDDSYRVSPSTGTVIRLTILSE